MQPLKVHIHKQHFTLNDNENNLQYDTFGFISGINKLEIPPLIPFSDVNYKNGNLIVEVIDHRHNDVKRLKLEPTNSSIENDVKRFIENYGDADPVEVEARLLPALFKIDLDKDLRTGLENNYNKRKFMNLKEPKSTVAEIQPDVTDLKLMLLMDKNRDLEFYPRFTQQQFVDEWKRKNEMARQESLIGLGDKNTIKLFPQGNSIQTRRQLIYNMNRRIIRTLRFHSVVNSKDVFTILNVYEVGEGSFEAVLRWGSVEGTATDGGTLRYALGNKQAVEYYIAHFKGFYGVLHALKSDSEAR